MKVPNSHRISFQTFGSGDTVALFHRTLLVGSGGRNYQHCQASSTKPGPTLQVIQPDLTFGRLARGRFVTLESPSDDACGYMGSLLMSFCGPGGWIWGGIKRLDITMAYGTGVICWSQLSATSVSYVGLQTVSPRTFGEENRAAVSIRCDNSRAADFNSIDQD
jgi:hypothetical protein